jgi:hypothetical protein
MEKHTRMTMMTFASTVATLQMYVSSEVAALFEGVPATPNRHGTSVMLITGLGGEEPM